MHTFGIAQQGTFAVLDVYAVDVRLQRRLFGAEDDNLLDVLNSLALKQELKKLSPKQKLILNLYFSGRFNQREIAALCELSVRGVGYQKDLAIKRIRDKFCK